MGRTRQVSWGLAATAAFVQAGLGGSDWLFEPSPGPGNLGNFLFDVDGSASDDVWAVGRADVGPGYPEPPDLYMSLALHWDGTIWVEVPTPNPGVFWNDLVAVKALAADDAWAVGSTTDVNFGTAQLLVLHWDGTAWSQSPAPTFTGGSVGRAVDAVGPDNVWIVGQRGGGVALALRWNGESFDTFELAPAGNEHNRLYGVAALAPDNVWAVGDWLNSGVFETSKPLFMRYNGSFWTIDLASFMFSQLSIAALNGVAAVAANDIWAVGSHSVSGEGTQPLIMHYNGSSWSQVPLPVFPDGAAELRAVDAHGPQDIWAAGTHATSEGVPRPLIMRYDGKTWSVVTAADSGGSHEWFRGVATVPGGDVWAVGQFYDGSMTTTLTERRPAALPVPGDATGDGAVNVEDLVAVILAWGPCPAPPEPDCPADLDGDGAVDVEDMVIVIINWG